jgi:hypothetical protein
MNKINHNLGCVFGCDNAVAIYYFDSGSVRHQDRLQALCSQHIIKTTPINGMEFVCSTAWAQSEPAQESDDNAIN